MKPLTPMRVIRENILKVSQRELAILTKVTQTTVSRWENGKLEPDRSNMLAIRDEAQRRGIRWSDKAFFEVPKSFQAEEAAQ